MEEIGAAPIDLVPLGFLYGSGNLYANGAHLYLGRIDRIGAPQLGEGIVAVECIDVEAFERYLAAGEILDSFTVAAFCHARARGLV